MWPEVEVLISTTYASAGYFEVSIVFAFFAWLFSERVMAMMELMSTKLYEACSTPGYNGSLKQSSSSLHHQLTQFQLRKREQIAQAKTLSVHSFESALYSLKENPWNMVLEQEKRPLMGLSCNDCCPRSRKNGGIGNEHFPIVDLLRVETLGKIRRHGILGSIFPTIRHCSTFKKYEYPYIYDTVLKDETVQMMIETAASEEALENGVTDPNGIEEFVVRQTKRAVAILNHMHSKLSDLALRIGSWVFYKTLPLLFTSMSIPQGQIEMLRKAAATGLPLIFLPLHRSHLDYIAVTFTLCNSGIRAPLVAAGENLRIPIFGKLLTGLGAFYIKRRMDPVSGKKDKLYRAVLHNYMTQCMQAGHYFEFFIEGGRTRTGKPCMPKGGLMSVFVDAYLSGILEDALLVPVSVNYEKIVEGNFVTELTGEPKKPETLMSALKGIWTAITSHYGLVRVDFNQPFSLHELVRSFQNKVMNKSGTFHIAPSSASLYGTDIVHEEQRQLVDSITRHILYDCTQSTAVMSTNAVAFLLLYYFRDGVPLSKLTFALDRLREELSSSKKDVGFSGESKDVVEHAVSLLGPGLVQIEKRDDDVHYKPVSILPNVLELNYYSNTLISHFCLRGVVGRVLLSLTADQRDAKVSIEKVIDVSILLCEILQFEFIFTKTCQQLNNAVFDVIEEMTMQEILTEAVTHRGGRSGYGCPRNLEIIDDEDDDFLPPETFYKVNREEEKLLFYARMLEPLIDTYCTVFSYLLCMMDQVVPEQILVKELLDTVKAGLDNGSIRYAESLSTDTIKNCMKLLEKWSVLECHIQEGTKVYYLNPKYESEEMLVTVIGKAELFRNRL